MSSEYEKQKRNKRIEREETAIQRQVRIAKKHRVSEYSPKVDEPHRYHKQHAMNCGNPDCFMCGNPRKFFGEKTLQERKFEQTEKYNDATIEQPSGSSED